MGIKELIEKYRLSKNPTPNELKDFIVATAKDVISLKFLEVKDDLQKQLEKIKDNVESRISEIFTLSRTYK